MTLTKRRDIDMTGGPMLMKILLFTLPVILSNLLQMLYNAADMIVVGLSSEPDAVGAIGTTGAFTSLILNLFIGLSVGATVIVARHIGAGEHERASAAVHTATVVGLCFGIFGAVVGIFVARPVLAMMGNQGKLLELSVRYTRVYFAAMPFHALSNYAISIHRAKGDTRTPLLVLSATGLLNVLLNLFFVLVCGMSVEGVSLATGIAAAVSAAVLYANLARDKGSCHFSFRKLCVDRAEMKQILLIGIPSGVQGAMFSISNMTIQSSIIKVNNTLCDPSAVYQPVVKGNAAAGNLEGFVYTSVNAMQQAAVAFTSQNMGARKPERVKRVMLCTYMLNAALGILLSLLLFALHTPLLSLYGVRNSATDELARVAYEAAMMRIYIVVLPYFIISAVEVGSGVLRGLGRSFVSTLISLVGICLVRVGWVFTVFRYFGTLESIYISYPISWAVTAAIQFFCITVLLRRLLATSEEAKTPTVG